MAKKLKFFLDTEFIETGRQHPLHLLSIGIVCENGNNFYREVKNAPFELANDWVKENVLPLLAMTDNIKTIEEVAEDVKSFIWANCELGLPVFEYKGNKERKLIEEIKPEFWGYFCDYDWVLFCQLFGTMSGLPKGFPYYCNDLKQIMKLVGEKKSLDELVGEKSNHNALDDALQIQKGFDIIKNGLENNQYEWSKGL